MRPQTPFVIGKALAVAFLLASCSRALAPTSDREATGSASGLGWSGPTAPEPQTARARLRFVGPVVTLDESGRPHVQQNSEYVIDAHELSLGGHGFPLDTVPALAVLKSVRWRLPDGEKPEYVIDSNPVFRLDDADFGTGYVPRAGARIMLLVPPTRVGGDMQVALFHQNFAPEVWWAGPDPSRFPPATDGDGRAVDVTNWSTFTTVPAWPPDGRGFFGPDSFAWLPSQRPPLGSSTFYEIRGDRIYARSEGDVVQQGSWVVFSIGGFDRDSPYEPLVDGPAPTLPPGFETQPRLYPVLTDLGLVGSPIGYRIWVPVRDASGGLIVPAETTTFPDFRTTSVMYNPMVGAYWRVTYPGKAYAVALTQDSHAAVSRTLENLIEVADRVDAGGGSARDRELRRRVLVFHVQAAAGSAGASAAHVRSNRGAKSR